MTDEVRSLYEANGGNPYLDGAYNAVDRGHTVFAQIIEGMDVVNRSAETKVDPYDRPVKDVVMKTVTVDTLLEAGVIKNPRDGVKILGNGDLTKKLDVKVNAFSASAKEKIEALGGTTEVI